MVEPTRTLNGVPKLPAWRRRIKGFQFILRPLEILDERARTLGDDYRVSHPNRQPALVYFSSPEALEALFTAKPDVVTAGRGNAILSVLLGEHGVVLLEGAAHQRQRQLLMPPFHGDLMRSYGDIIREIAAQTFSQWDVGTSFEVRPAMQSISLQVILKAVFGLKTGSRYDKLQRAIAQMLDSFGSPVGAMFLFYKSWQQDWGAWSPWGRFLRSRQQVDDLLYAEIAERRSQQGAMGTDILSLLLAARDDAGEPLSDVELRDELITLLFAGHETTASALAWAMYWIATRPEIRAKLLAELATLGDNRDSMAIARLPYLNAICQETLRLYPIAIGAFPREVLQPVVLAGYALEPGTVIMPSIYLAHHRAEAYPNPKEFRPERFLERQFSPYEYLPFGGGDRRCIGSAFAMFEMKLVLAELLSRWELELDTRQPIRPVRRGLTVAPSKNLKMRATNRYQERYSRERSLSNFVKG